MRLAGVLTLLMAAALEGRAQRATPAGVDRRGVPPAEPGRSTPGAREMPQGRGLLSPDSSWWVPVSSALIPGLGQIRLGQNRFVAYVAAESFAIFGYVSAESEARREGDRYRALAWNVSRAFFENRSGGGDWPYYEAMRNYVESGVWNRGGGTNFIPETDLNTYNGIVWQKARELSHWPDPDVEPPRSSNEFQDALRYYLKHAVAPEMRWSWRNAQLEWDDFRQSINRKNEASRSARHYLGVIAVNHLLSTVDAFVTIRLRGGLGAPQGGYELRASMRFP